MFSRVTDRREDQRVSDRRVLRIEAPVWLLVLGCVVWLLVVAGIVWLLVTVSSSSGAELPVRLRAVCAQYASLDLAGLAPICRDVGYQQTIEVQGTRWPIVSRAVMPEDLDRA
jgi:hypothetical protein